MTAASLVVEMADSMVGSWVAMKVGYLAEHWAA